MKLLSTVLVSGLWSLCSATQQQTHVYLFDSSSSPSPVNDLLQDHVATLVLAQRLGLSDSFLLEGIDEANFETLRTYGGEQRPLFGNDAAAELSKLLLLVEGISDPKDVFPSSASDDMSTRSFAVTGNSNNIGDELEEAFDQSIASTEMRCTYSMQTSTGVAGKWSYAREGLSKCPSSSQTVNAWEQTSNTLANLETFNKLMDAGVSGWATEGTTAIFHVSVPNDDYSKVMEVLRTTVKSLKSLAKSGQQESTIILLPSTSTTGKTMTKRSKSPVLVQHEQILSSAEPESSSPASSPAQPLASNTLSNADSLTICHSSMDTCVSATNNCTGHGSCFLKYRTNEGASTPRECYACGCEATYLDNEDGTKRALRWGGAACQKKDVSSPFILLAGFTIAMIAVITWAIGLMFSMGSEELPSVIGAGVAGPRAQK
ncbi:MAG: hypothetical protein M1834_004662 [Cirrosporium novae-zelandiae]|nr:MAG: hypothetical protein M1834_004662 [Cirrosporium novae-zelandiae]